MDTVWADNKTGSISSESDDDSLTLSSMSKLTEDRIHIHNFPVDIVIDLSDKIEDESEIKHSKVQDFTVKVKTRGERNPKSEFRKTGSWE